MQFITPNGNAKPSRIYLVSGILFLAIFVAGVYGIFTDKMEFDNVSPVVLYFAFILCLIFCGFLSAVCLVCGIKAFKKPKHRMVHHKKRNK